MKLKLINNTLYSMFNKTKTYLITISIDNDRKNGVFYEYKLFDSLDQVDIEVNFDNVIKQPNNEQLTTYTNV